MTKFSWLLSFAGVCLFVTSAYAQNDPYECDDNFQECGTPQQSGGGGGGGGGGSILINNTDLGDTYQYADDYDDDGIEDPYDNCPFDDNPDQADDDGDGIGTACDNCPVNFNPIQENLDGDLEGDLCDADIDGDGVANADDICEVVPDPLQKDTDGDGDGDACDDDMDDDGIDNLEDNCPLVPNPDQLNEDPDVWGDACDDDDDGDGIRNLYDNCPYVANYDQLDMDEDTIGDTCDADMDGDVVVNLIDNCPTWYNPEQVDYDRDGVGEECDDRYCYVVMGDLDECLDPSDAFTVYAPDLETQTGDFVRLRLFANRVNQPMRYTWEIVEAPVGSHATIDSPTGAASVSTPYEYHYLKDRIVTFTPDKPGTYEVRVVAELVWEDVITGEMEARAETYAFIEVTGDPLTSCNASVTGFEGTRGYFGLAALMVLIGGLVASRKR